MWLRVHRRLRENRHGLGLVASEQYAGVPRVGSTSLLTRPEWLPDAPIPLEDVRLEWDAAPDPPAVTDPPDGLPDGFATYADAMAALAAPALFENRPGYRLLSADLGGRGGQASEPVMRIGPAWYFDAVNVGEAVAHELAAHELAAHELAAHELAAHETAAQQSPPGTAPASGTPVLPLRARVGDPCDLSRRAALPAITTLTVTMSGSYVLHWRDPAKVAHAGGLYQVMPVGVFQPLADGLGDLDLWRCMVREYAEELLGGSEDYGKNGEPFDQEAWPFHVALTAARRDGRVRVHCLGLGVDPLTLALDVLTVAVFDDAAFAEFFGGLVRTNAEGRVSTARFGGTVPGPMQPAGAAALELAWRHRAALGISRG